MDDVVMNDEKRMSEVLERTRDELLGLPAESLGKANVLRGHAVVLTRTVVASFQTLEAMLEEEFSPSRAAELRARARGLGDRALAFFAADLAREERYNAEESQRVDLVERVAGYDRYLLKWAWPLFGDDDFLAGILADIQRGRGAQDDAEDVLRLVELFRASWELADGQTPVTLEYLTRAETDATELVTVLDADIRDEKRDLARRAFTAWRDDYREILFAGRYLLRDQDNASELFPGIRARQSAARSRRRGAAPDDVTGGAGDAGGAEQGAPDEAAPEAPVASDDASGDATTDSSIA